MSLLTVAYLGFHFGGGGGVVQNSFVKVGVFAWRVVPCNAWQSQAFARGVRGYGPPKKFLKWCNLVHLENILLKFCKKKIVKIFIFYIKTIDNVLLRKLYLGVLEHTPQIYCQLCNLVCFGAHFP